MARITYPSDGAGPREGWLIYVKPTLTGEEPADVLHYANANPSFPQQTTADQFFDEAQWESYRRLHTEAESNRIAADLWKRVEHLQFGDQVIVSTSVPKANLQYFANVDAFAKVRGKG